MSTRPQRLLLTRHSGSLTAHFPVDIAITDTKDVNSENKAKATPS